MYLILPSLLITALALIVGIVIHESAHALAAYALGDRTARERGRVSLNPLNHIDPFGTVLLPLLMLLAGGPVFAFAKPVPVYLGNLRNPKRDEVLVALAGPVSNIALAALAAVALRLLTASGGLASTLYWSDAAPVMQGLVSFLFTCISVNASLAFFNLIPLPPLDGSSVIVPFLRGDALRTYYQLQRYAMPVLIIALYLLPSLTGIDIVGWYFSVTADPLVVGLVRFGMGL